MRFFPAGFVSCLLLGVALCTSGCVTELYSQPRPAPVYSRTVLPAASRVALILDFRGGEPAPDARAEVREILADYLASRGSVLVADPADADYVVYAVLERRNPGNPYEWTVVSTSSARSLGAFGDEFEWPGGIIEVEDDDYVSYSYIGFGVFYPIWFDLWDSPWHRGRMILRPPPHRPHRPEVRWREDRRWHRPQRWVHKEPKPVKKPEPDRKDRDLKRRDEPTRAVPDQRRDQLRADRRQVEKPQSVSTVQKSAALPVDPKRPTSAKPAAKAPKPSPTPVAKPQPQPPEQAPHPQPTSRPATPTASPRPAATASPQPATAPQADPRASRASPREKDRTLEAMKRAEREKAAAKAKDKKAKRATTGKAQPENKDKTEESDSGQAQEGGRR